MRVAAMAAMAGLIGLSCAVSDAALTKSYTPTLGGAPITFEGFGEGTLISSQYSGVTFGQNDGGTPMIDNYTWLYGYGCSSGSGVLTGSTTGGAPFPTVAGITVSFDSPVSAAEVFFSDTAPLGNYDISAFGAGGVLLESFLLPASEILPPGYGGGSLPAPGTFPLPGIFVGFSRPTADIVSVQIGPSQAYGDAFAIDDVRFESGDGGVVPEPSTLLIWSLLGCLGITVGWWRRRKAG
jgi:hypothetical protein